jgi:hypothetical protein
MTDITITRPLRRWHKLLKAMGEVRPGLTMDGAFCDKVTALIEASIAGLCGKEPHGITRPEDSWRNLVNFCERHNINFRDGYQQLLGITTAPKPPEPVDPEALELCRMLNAMDDDEFDAATRPHTETKETQKALF